MDGDALVWNEYNYLRHSTNLTEFMRMTDETANMTDLFPQSHMRKLLETDNGHVRTLLAAISVHHRMARSLDFLGSALKFITPDADDFHQIRMTEA